MGSFQEVIDPAVENTKQNSAVTSVSSDQAQSSGNKNGVKSVQCEDGRERHNGCWQRDRKWKGTLEWKTESAVKNITGCEVSFIKDTSAENEDEGHLPELLSLTFTEKGLLKRPGKFAKFKSFVFHLDNQDELEKLLKTHVGAAYFKNKQNVDETLALTLFKCGQKQILLGFSSTCTTFLLPVDTRNNVELPVIQCTPQQWAAPPTPEDDVSMSPQPGPFLAESISNDIQSLPTSWQEDFVTVDLDSINSIIYSHSAL